MARMGAGAGVRGAAPQYPDAMRRPANPRGAEPVAVAIPPGGHARVEKIDNGVLVTAHDRNYNMVAQVHAPSVDCLRMK